MNIYIFCCKIFSRFHSFRAQPTFVSLSWIDRNIVLNGSWYDFHFIVSTKKKNAKISLILLLTVEMNVIDGIINHERDIFYPLLVDKQSNFYEKCIICLLLNRLYIPYIPCMSMFPVIPLMYQIDDGATVITISNNTSIYLYNEVTKTQTVNWVHDRYPCSCTHNMRKNVFNTAQYMWW